MTNATGSPKWRISGLAKAGCAREYSDGTEGSGVPCGGAFSCVITNRTPGDCPAREQLIFVIRPRPMVAPTMEPYSGWPMSSLQCSKAYVALPLTLSGPSTRFRGCPIMSVPLWVLDDARERVAQRTLGELDLEIVVSP